ncbi:hypothetical protein TrispH2_011883 [Trichoplax sp. H2]|nr:hypothetical protein TrispH2_011883 [Trichoplax sp. H2]|eukprot:RDD36178.1 hypothetical protein TrispH2_011883 [Trichoplax sp. H2]
MKFTNVDLSMGGQCCQMLLTRRKSVDITPVVQESMSSQQEGTTTQNGIKPVMQESTTSQQGETATQNTMDPIQDDSNRRSIFIDIADKIESTKLAEFGRKLHLSSNSINEIVDSNNSRFWKVDRLLEAWYSEFSSTTKLDTLLKVLCECREGKMAEKLKEEYCIQRKE